MSFNEDIDPVYVERDRLAAELAALYRAGDNLAHASPYAASPAEHQAWWDLRRGACTYCSDMPPVLHPVTNKIVLGNGSISDELGKVAAKFPVGARVIHDFAGLGTVSGAPYLGTCSEIYVPTKWVDPNMEEEGGWHASRMRVVSPYPEAHAPKPDSQRFWRCKHHPSAIDNYFGRKAFCEHGCDGGPSWFNNGNLSERREIDSECKPATS
jgi:hypothetical protein